MGQRGVVVGGGGWGGAHFVPVGHEEVQLAPSSPYPPPPPLRPAPSPSTARAPVKPSTGGVWQLINPLQCLPSRSYTSVLSRTSHLSLAQERKKKKHSWLSPQNRAPFSPSRVIWLCCYVITLFICLADFLIRRESGLAFFTCYASEPLSFF